MTRGWLLNLHAELERGPSADPLRAARERPELIARAVGLVPTGDVVIETAGHFEGVDTALAWCPTAAVRALAARAGIAAERWPPLATTERVLSRRWNAERLGLPLTGATLIDDRKDLARALAIDSPTGSLLLRTMRGFAGKGRRICRSGAPSAADFGFAEAALRGGGLLVEPLVQITQDLSIHGFVAPPGVRSGGVGQGGGVTLGRVVVTSVGSGGVWRGARLGSSSETSDLEPELRLEALRAAEALAKDGYWGPFGVDAVRFAPWRGRSWARCEVNARYSMAWALGMGEARPDLRFALPFGVPAGGSGRDP